MPASTPTWYSVRRAPLKAQGKVHDSDQIGINRALSHRAVSPPLYVFFMGIERGNKAGEGALPQAISVRMIVDSQNTCQAWNSA
jgi:hypothetical protein